MNSPSIINVTSIDVSLSGYRRVTWMFQRVTVSKYWVEPRFSMITGNLPISIRRRFICGLVSSDVVAILHRCLCHPWTLLTAVEISVGLLS